jgi:hypothetical protein
VIGGGGLTVLRLHGIFGSEKRLSYTDTKINDTKPFDPKHLTYEVFGPPGTVADISYFDVNADPQLVQGDCLSAATVSRSVSAATPRLTPSMAMLSSCMPPIPAVISGAT